MKQTMPAPFEPSQEQRLTVKLHKVAGTPDEMIARCIVNPGTGQAITKKTLYKHFRDELDLGKLEVDVLTTGKLIGAIKNGEAWAICFYAKTRLGWSEKVDHNHSGRIETMSVDEINKRIAELVGEAGASGVAGREGTAGEDGAD